ncbi:sulfatase-like hydrolase/transferase [Bacteroidota bacterium]
MTDRLGDECLEFLENFGDNPFFLYLSFYTVHTPIQGCMKYDEEYRLKAEQLPNKGERQIRPEHSAITRLNQSDNKYAAMVRSMDENIGRVIGKIEELGKTNNTIIVFTSDNGGLSTTPKSWQTPTSVLPFRAGKGWLYEGGIRVPLIIHTPDLKQKGTVCNSPVISMDFYPTLLELAGFKLKPEQHMDGKSIVPLLNQPETEEERTLVWHYPHYHGSKWRLGSAIRKGNWKLVEFYEEDLVELYDLRTDMEEMKDLAPAMPEKAEELKKLMHIYIDERGGQYPEKIEN